MGEIENLTGRMPVRRDDFDEAMAIIANTITALADVVDGENAKLRRDVARALVESAGPEPSLLARLRSARPSRTMRMTGRR